MCFPGVALTGTVHRNLDTPEVSGYLAHCTAKAINNFDFVWNVWEPTLFHGLRVIFDPRGTTASHVRAATVGLPALTTTDIQHAVE
jgi:hypothetical protein